MHAFAAGGILAIERAKHIEPIGNLLNAKGLLCRLDVCIVFAWCMLKGEEMSLFYWRFQEYCVSLQK